MSTHNRVLWDLRSFRPQQAAPRHCLPWGPTLLQPLPCQNHRSQLHHPQPDPQPWECPRPCQEPTFRTYLPGRSKARSRGVTDVPASAGSLLCSLWPWPRGLSWLLPAVLSCSCEFSALFFFFLKGLFFFFFLRCVRTVAWRRQSYSATSPFSRDPLQPLIHTSPPAAPGLGRPDAHRVLKPCCCTFPARTWTGAASPPQGEAIHTRLPNPRRNQTQMWIKKKN